MRDLHGIIFAYESDSRLRELTQHRNNASIPYGGRYRIIDFMLSNMVNAGVTDVGLVVHETYQSLLDHIGSGKDWDLSRKRGGLRILPPFGFADRRGPSIYRGRMDALGCVYSYLKTIRQEYVVLAGGNLILNFPLEEMFREHLRSGADITAACTHRHTASSRHCTYFSVGDSGLVTDVSVRPSEAMGCECLDIFILSKTLLISLVDHCVSHNISSMSEGILQAFAPILKISPYFFDGFVARIHSVSDYYQCSMELLDPAVRANLFHPARPVRTKDTSTPSTYYGEQARSFNSLIADGCIIEGEVENSILFRGVRVEKGAKVKNCILMQSTSVGRDAVLEHVIADKDVVITPGRTLVGQASYPVAVEKRAVV